MYNYDYDGTLIGFTLYSQGYTFDYIYVMNQLGDITHIITTSGTVAVEYKYDAYGNVVEVIGDANIANANSFRYRSYKYDIETDLFYLNSRYYNPEIGRFINADGLIGQTGNVKSTNMFAYCTNNPIAYTDPTGYFTGVEEFVGLALLLVAYVVVAIGVYVGLVETGVMDDFNNFLDGIITDLKDLVQSAARVISETVNGVITTVKANIRNRIYEYHHIVPQTAALCLGARDILVNKVDIPIDSMENIIILEYGTHRHLHTAAYYMHVESVITAAYIEGQSFFMNKLRVEAALAELRLEIRMGLW